MDKESFIDIEIESNKFYRHENLMMPILKMYWYLTRVFLVVLKR